MDQIDKITSSLSTTIKEVEELKSRYLSMKTPEIIAALDIRQKLSSYLSLIGAKEAELYKYKLETELSTKQYLANTFKENIDRGESATKISKVIMTFKPIIGIHKDEIEVKYAHKRVQNYRDSLVEFINAMNQTISYQKKEEEFRHSAEG